MARPIEFETVVLEEFKKDFGLSVITNRQVLYFLSSAATAVGRETH